RPVPAPRLPARPPLHDRADPHRGVRGGGTAPGAARRTKGVLMAFVDINPRYRAALVRRGLVTPEDFVDLPGVVVGGHADRYVARVTLGDVPDAVPGYLKREHRIPWRDRLASAWAGCGF